MKAIGYFRESRDQTLGEQSEMFLDFCRRNGYEATAAFLDVRADSELSGFHQMLEFVRQQAAGGFLMLVIARVANLGENMTEIARRYFQLASLGAPVIAIESGEDATGSLLEAWADYRHDGSLGDRVKAAMRRRAVTGEVLGRPPYGYKVGPRRRLVVVPEEGAVVRYIFRLYLKDDLGIRRIARRLNEEGLRTRKDGLWSMVTVRDILRNRAYLGTYSRFGVRVPASHAPLISQEDFQRVQDCLDQRRPIAASRRQVSPFLLSGLAHCGYCGNKMIGVTRKQRWKRVGDGEVRTAQYRYYQCESRTNRSLCDYHTRRAELLEAEVKKSLLLGKSAVVKHSEDGGAGPRADDEVRRLLDKVRRLDKRLEQCMDAAVSGGLNAEKLRAAATALGAEHLKVQEHLLESMREARAEKSKSEREGRRQKVLRRLLDEWDDLPFDDRQEMLRDVLARIVVKDDGIETVLRA